MATVNLGRIKPVFRGAYSGSTAYVVDDIVTHGNESFICIQAHGAGTQATSQGSYWTKLAAKGTDGTDVGTTITTQGDILYRDGSGLQRLAKGTASQVLKMNTAANAPEWGDLSSDFVKIQSTTVDSNVSSVTLTGFDDSLYASYLCKMSNAKTEVTTTQRGKISMRVQTAGGVQSGSTDYIWNMFYHYRRWDNDSQVDAHSNTEGSSSISLHDWYLSNNGRQNTVIWFANPSASDHVKIFDISTTAFKHTSTSSDGPYTMSPENITGIYNSNTAITGLNFFPTGSSSSYIAGGNFSLYGLKK